MFVVKYFKREPNERIICRISTPGNYSSWLAALITRLVSLLPLLSIITANCNALKQLFFSLVILRKLYDIILKA